jgi:hypothetical protein
MLFLQNAMLEAYQINAMGKPYYPIGETLMPAG